MTTINRSVLDNLDSPREETTNGSCKQRNISIEDDSRLLRILIILKHKLENNQTIQSTTTKPSKLLQRETTTADTVALDIISYQLDLFSYRQYVYLSSDKTLDKKPHKKPRHVFR